jgi:hypothetical protein
MSLSKPAEVEEYRKRLEVFVRQLSCSEVNHRGLECRPYFFQLLSAGISGGLKMYVPLYLVTGLLSGKFDVQKVASSIIRSTLFIGTVLVIMLSSNRSILT